MNEKIGAMAATAQTHTGLKQYCISLEQERSMNAVQHDTVCAENALLKQRVEGLIRQLEKETATEPEYANVPRPKEVVSGVKELESSGQAGARSKESQTSQTYPPFMSLSTAESPSSSSSMSDEGDGSLPRDYRRSNLWQDLQRAMIETQKILDKNRRLKQKLQFLKRSLTGSTAGGSPRERSELEQENIELRRINEDLMMEITALKRTVEEQSIYLLQIGREDSVVMSAIFPPVKESKHGSFAQKPIETSQTDHAKLKKVYEERAAAADSKFPSTSKTRSTDSRISVKSLSSEFNRLASAESASSEPVRLRRPQTTSNQTNHIVESPERENSGSLAIKIDESSVSSVKGKSADPSRNLREQAPAAEGNIYDPLPTRYNFQHFQPDSNERTSEPAQRDIPTSSDASSSPDKVIRQNGREGNLDNLRKENLQLREEITALRRTWCEYDLIVDQERDHFNAEIKLMKRQVESLSAETAEKDSKINDLTELTGTQKSELEQVSELQSECEEIVADYKSLLSELAKSGIMRAGLDDKPFETVTEMSPFNEFRNCMRTYEEKEKERLYLIEQNIVLQNELSKLKEEMINLEDSERVPVVQEIRFREELQQKHDELQRRFDDKSTERQQLMNALEMVKADKMSLTEEMKILKDKLHMKETEILQLSSSMQRQQEAAKVENDALKLQLESKLPRLSPEDEDQLLAEIDELTLEGNVLRKELKDREKETDELRGELCEQLDGLKAKLEATQQRADKDCAEFMDDQEALTAENERLRGELVQFERDFNEAEALFAIEKRSAENERQQLLDELDRLRCQRSDKDSEFFNINEGLLNENDKLHTELSRINAEKREMSMHFRKLEANFRQFEEFKVSLYVLKPIFKICPTGTLKFSMICCCRSFFAACLCDILFVFYA